MKNIITCALVQRSVYQYCMAGLVVDLPKRSVASDLPLCVGGTLSGLPSNVGLHYMRHKKCTNTNNVNSVDWFTSYPGLIYSLCTWKKAFVNGNAPIGYRDL